jgi:DNA replication protein DnaC
MEMERLKQRLKALHLPTMAAELEAEAKKAIKLKLSYTEFFANLVERECETRMDRSTALRIKKARFPFVRTLEEFEFSFQPSISEPQMKELGHLAFLGKAENILWVGDQGTGKTHLAIALGVKACMAKKKVLFLTVLELVERLTVARVDGTFAKKLLELSRLDLLILDELGYQEISKAQAQLLFQVVAKRYEHGSILLTTNQTFENWGEALAGDKVVATAMIDRLLHHSHIIAIQGPSYRMKDKVITPKRKEVQNGDSTQPIEHMGSRRR